jgi:hypothetical protein
MKIYTPIEKKKIQSHPLFIKYSGNIPDDLRHLVYPDEARTEPEKKGKKASVAAQTETADGDSN